MSTQSLATQASATPAAVKSDAGQSGSGISALKIMNYTILVLLTLVFVGPLFFILMNSFKGRFFISSSPFALPIGDYFVGLTNYTSGLAVTNFFNAMGWSFVITIGSVTVIVFFTAMTAYYITRIKARWTNVVYLIFVFSMIVPFQAVMFPTIKIADMLGLSNPAGMMVLYLGFGAGLSVFIFSGFVKSIPLEIEEAATIDGCGPLKTYFYIVFPMLKPVAITVAILNTMWVWNDYLVALIFLGGNPESKVITQRLADIVGSRGNDWHLLTAGAFITMLLPLIVFFSLQRFFVRGLLAGSVKG